ATQGFFKTHSGGSLRGTSLLFGQFGLRVTEGGRLQDKQIDAARTVMRRVVKEEKGANFHLKCMTDRPCTSKPAEVRMGKGKGAVEFFASWVPKGRVIFEVSCARREIGLNAMRVAAAAIPLRTEIVEVKRDSKDALAGLYQPQLGVKPPRCLPFFIKRRLAEKEFADKLESRRAERAASLLSVASTSLTGSAANISK
ncbi:ribosomal protein L10e/L16, partial [Chytriomyces sp. MP71]